MFRGQSALCVSYFLLLAILHTTMSIPAKKDRFIHENRPNSRETKRRCHKEVKKYEDVSQEIINYVTNGAGKHQTYNRLARMTDKFGKRMVGSEALENTIDYMVKRFKADGLENVHTEEVTNMPHWVRGKESATLLEPRNYEMSILGLGSSIGTSCDGITAEVLVVHSFDELHQKAAEVRIKYTLINILITCHQGN